MEALSPRTPKLDQMQAQRHHWGHCLHQLQTFLLLFFCIKMSSQLIAQQYIEKILHAASLSMI